MKKVFENKKVRIAVAAVLLVIIVVVIAVSVKSCSKESGSLNGNARTEQGQENGKDEDGLTVVDPEDEKTENGIDASGSWDEPSKSSEPSKPDSAGNEKDKNENNDNKSDDADNASKEDGDDILKDEKKWGQIF